MGLIKGFKTVRHIIYQICGIFACLSFFVGVLSFVAFAIFFYCRPESKLIDILFGTSVWCGVVFILTACCIVVPHELSKEEGHVKFPWD